MSYILEALKKSEKERQRGTVPDPMTAHESVPREPQKRSLWPFLIAGALFINAIVLILWIAPWSPKKQNIPAQSDEKIVASKAPEMYYPEPSKSDSKQKTAKEKISSQDVAAQKSENVIHNRPLDVQSSVQKKGTDKPVQTVDSKKSDASSPAIPEQKSRTADSAHEKKLNNNMTPLKNKIYSLNELPSAIKQNLPDFKITVFLYSDDPASRMVRINGQAMKEGEYLVAGLKLEQIIHDAVILSYQNYRFRIDLK